MEKRPAITTSKKLFTFLLLLLISSSYAKAQVKNKGIDTTIYDYDALFDELEHFIDSLTAPRSFTTINLDVSKGYFNYESNSSALLKASKQFILTPSVGYFDKSGFGINASASVLRNSGKFNLFQYAATASYDYVQDRRYMTGVSFTHYFTKDSLPFYTSPLNNEANIYFAYRNLWIKPMIAVSYGWGTRNEYEKREKYVSSMRLIPIGYTTINTEEKVSDLSVTASVKHDFYWLNVLTNKDYVRLSPQLLFVSGTQKFGFNQTNNSYLSNKKTGNSVLYNSENVYLSDQTTFKPLAVSARIRSEFSKGKFFIQPQLMLDYYLPAKENNLSTAFAINTGVIL